MKDHRRHLESLNPEPSGGVGWSETDAGRRARARVEARLDPTAVGLRAAPGSRVRVGWLIAAPALVVLLAVGLPLLLLGGSGPGGAPSVPLATTEAGSAAAATTSTLAVPPGREYQYVGMVLDKEGVGPQLCLFVEESLPPQCGGTPVVGLDWAEVPWAETAGDTTWAEASLVGTFDGATFTLTQSPAPAGDGQGSAPHPDFTSPCPVPSGGWVVTDPALATQEAFDAAQAYAASQPGHAGLWIDQLGEVAGEGGFDPAGFVLNVTFTGELAAHETALRAIYGGPLCVSGAERSAAELEAILGEIPAVLTTPEAEAAGIYAGTGAGYYTDISRDVVVAEVFAVTGDGQAWVDARFGPGVVELYSVLTPVIGS